MADWLRERLDARVDVDGLLTQRRFVYGDGRSVCADDAVAPDTFVWFHRDLRDEPEVPGELIVVHRDERLVVVDKPAFLSTIPRGDHVRQSLVVRLRDELGLPELSSLHRLDRVTSGLVVCTTQSRWRAPYHQLFELGEVAKTYRALAPLRDGLPIVVREPIDGRPAQTRVELETAYDGQLAVYRLTPTTGRRHQLRRHLAHRGIAILGDPLYPVDRHVDIDDFSTPLQLLAAELAFTDPVDGVARRFVSGRELPLQPGDTF